MSKSQQKRVCIQSECDYRNALEDEITRLRSELKIAVETIGAVEDVVIVPRDVRMNNGS